MCLGSRTLAQLFVGIQFTLLTDVKPLLSTFDPSSSKVLPPHIQRLAWSLHQHSFNIPHIPGKLTQQNRRLDYRQSLITTPIAALFARTMCDLCTIATC